MHLATSRIVKDLRSTILRVAPLINKSPDNAKPDDHPRLRIARRNKIIAVKTKAIRLESNRIEVLNTNIPREATDTQVQI